MLYYINCSLNANNLQYFNFLIFLKRNLSSLFAIIDVESLYAYCLLSV